MTTNATTTTTTMTTRQPHSPASALPRHDIAALKDRILIAEAWQILGLPGQPGAHCRSPFRPDNSPSFSIYDGGRRWKDFATNAGGDVIDFIAAACQTDAQEATRRFLAMAGVAASPRAASPAPSHPHSAAHPSAAAPSFSASTHAAPGAVVAAEAAAGKASSSVCSSAPLGTSFIPRPARSPEQVQAAEGLRHLPLNRGCPQQWAEVAATRQLGPEAVSLALSLRTLTYGMVCGFSCWILTDDDRRIAEARRVDGRPFPAAGPLGPRKAHTLRGSRKAWPVGVEVLRRIPEFRAIMLVEGGPDYLAALHFAAQFEAWDVLPVAMLGRSAGTRLDREALALLAGRRVRIYPHADADGGGVSSARLWARQLRLQGGCEVDLFSFDHLTRRDGRPVNDLNDCTDLREADLGELKALLP